MNTKKTKDYALKSPSPWQSDKEFPGHISVARVYYGQWEGHRPQTMTFQEIPFSQNKTTRFEESADYFSDDDPEENTEPHRRLIEPSRNAQPKKNILDRFDGKRNTVIQIWDIAIATQKEPQRIHYVRATKSSFSMNSSESLTERRGLQFRCYVCQTGRKTGVRLFSCILYSIGILSHQRRIDAHFSGDFTHIQGIEIIEKKIADHINN